MKKSTILKAALLAVFCFMAMGASAPVQNIRITIGGGINKTDTRYVLDKTYPFTLPLMVEWDKPLGGCGGTSKQKFGIELNGEAHIYANTNTGESYLRFPKLSYNVVLSASGEPTATPAD